MASLADILAALAAAGITLDAPTADNPIVAAPVAPRVASPFSAVAGTAGPSSPAAEARRLYPASQAAQRAHVAVSMADGFTCSVDTTATLADGTTVPSALHGFTTAHKPGDPCPGIRGIGKGESCPGVIRG